MQGPVDKDGYEITERDWDTKYQKWAQDGKRDDSLKPGPHPNVDHPWNKSETDRDAWIKQKEEDDPIDGNRFGNEGEDYY